MPAWLSPTIFPAIAGVARDVNQWMRPASPRARIGDAWSLEDELDLVGERE